MTIPMKVRLLPSQSNLRLTKIGFKFTIGVGRLSLQLARSITVYYASLISWRRWFNSTRANQYHKRVIVMDKKIRNKLMYSLENALDELYMMEKNSSFKTHQKQEAADTVNAFIRVYNYYTKPEDQITLLKLLDCDRFDDNRFDEGL